MTSVGGDDLLRNHVKAAAVDSTREIPVIILKFCYFVRVVLRRIIHPKDCSFAHIRSRLRYAFSFATNDWLCFLERANLILQIFNLLAYLVRSVLYRDFHIPILD